MRPGGPTVRNERGAALVQPEACVDRQVGEGDLYGAASTHVEERYQSTSVPDLEPTESPGAVGRRDRRPTARARGVSRRRHAIRRRQVRRALDDRHGVGPGAAVGPLIEGEGVLAERPTLAPRRRCAPPDDADPLAVDREAMPAGSETASTVPVLGWRSTDFVFAEPGRCRSP